MTESCKKKMTKKLTSRAAEEFDERFKLTKSALSPRLISLAVATVVAGCGAPIAANDAADVTVCQQ
jgi:hypothetical protein